MDSYKTKNVDTLLAELNVTGQEVYDEIVILTEDYDNATKNEVRLVCAYLLGISDTPVYSETFVVYCKNQITGKELKGLMNFNTETGEAEYTFTSLEAGVYSFRIVDVDNLINVGTTNTGFSGSDLQNVQVVYNTNTDMIMTYLSKSDITKSDLSSCIDKLVNYTQQGDIYKPEDEAVFLTAITQAQEILDKESPTQEELNKAYENINSAFNKLEIIGWINTSPYLIGDTDKSGDINIVDATNVQMYVTGLAENNNFYCFGDVDGDRNISIKDATAIQCYCGKMTDKAEQVGTETYNYFYDFIYNI